MHTGPRKMTVLTLNPATEADLPEICRLHIASWQDAYRGLLPDEYLDVHVPRALGTHWTEFSKGDWIVTVARAGGALRGFIAVDLQHAGEGAYVDNLHADPGARGLGTGRRLMADAARQLMARGVGRMWLTVLAGNAASRGFYRAIGGTEGAEWEEDLFGLRVLSLPVTWDDLAALAARG